MWQYAFQCKNNKIQRSREPFKLCIAEYNLCFFTFLLKDVHLNIRQTCVYYLN